MTAVDQAQTPLRTALRVSDRWFRAWGTVTLVLLLLTAGALLLDVERWRLPFALAHLAALLALVPLGAVLVLRALIEARREVGTWPAAPGRVVRRHRLVTALVLVSFGTVAVSLANFPDGERALRTGANLATVAIVSVLVVRYLRRARTA